jgi:hypothetical protein
MSRQSMNFVSTLRLSHTWITKTLVALKSGDPEHADYRDHELHERERERFLDEGPKGELQAVLVSSRACG